MGKMKWDPEQRVFKVTVKLDERPLDPEHERIIKANEVRILREAGYLPLKSRRRDNR